MPEDELPEQKQPIVSRRQFLKGVGAVGAATAFGTALLDRGDAANESVRDDSHAPIQRGTIHLTLNVNGKARTVEVEPRTTLLNALRNHMNPPVTGPKLVCDRGECGACTVEANGRTIYSCMTLAADAVDKKITTIEGLGTQDQLSPLQEAFVAHDALMCGFCTPGFIMSIHNALEKNPNPTREQVKHACAGNTCRCGTYPKIFEAALDAARKKGNPNA